MMMPRRIRFSMVPVVAGLLSLLSVIACSHQSVTTTRIADNHEESTTLLAGGKVFSGGDELPVVADVLIRGDRIAGVGPPGSLSADRTIDVAGLAVAPGFIDLHSHAVRDSAARSGLFRWPNGCQLRCFCRSRRGSPARDRPRRSSGHGGRNDRHARGGEPGDA